MGLQRAFNNPGMGSAHSCLMRNLSSSQFLLSVLLAATATSLLGSSAQAARTICEKAFIPRHGFVQVGESKNISQLIRSNSGHYWSFLRTETDLTDLNPYLSFQGVVTGDPHLGNFSVVPVKGLNGRRSLEFVDIDFDDAGRAPFALDFARLMVAAKAVSEDIKAVDLTDAYISGLRGENRQAPEVIQDALEMKISEYDRKTDRYTSKKTDESRFRYDTGDVTEYTGPVTREHIQAVFPNAKVLDFASRVKERGGSSESLRFWVLVRENGKKRIYELKAWAPSGVSGYRGQMAPSAWLKDINKVLRADLDPDGYTLVNVGNEGLFWLREKKVNLIDVDFNGKSSKEKAFAVELALYDAWYVGRLHGSQPNASKYLAQIEADKEKFKSAIKALAKEYLRRAVDALDN